MRNPFTATLPKFAEHRYNGRCLEFAASGGFLSHSGRPVVPPVSEAVGKVLFIAGPKSCGKSVFSHQCMHDYVDQGRIWIDGHPWTNLRAKKASEEVAEGHFLQLLSTLQSKGMLNAARGEQLLERLRDRELNWDLRHDVLAKALKNNSLVVRLPSTNSSGTTGAVIDDVSRYSLAAEKGDNIYLYEYQIDDDEHWKTLESDLEEVPRSNITIIRVPSHSPEEYWDFVRHRVPEDDLGPPLLTILREPTIGVLQEFNLTLPQLKRLFQTMYDNLLNHGGESVLPEDLFIARASMIMGSTP